MSTKRITAKELKPGDKSGIDTVQRVRVDEAEGTVTITWVDRLALSVWRLDEAVNVYVDDSVGHPGVSPDYPYPYDHWYDDREVLASVLARSIDTSDIMDLDTARYFVEKPWKYDELHAAWLLDPDYGGDPK